MSVVAGGAGPAGPTLSHSGAPDLPDHVALHHDVRGAAAVYTDAWTSMGAEAEADLRRLRFAGFRVDAGLLAAAPQALVMHCLPAHRGEEISDETIEYPQSVVLDQTENRLYVQQALLVDLLADSAALGR